MNETFSIVDKNCVAYEYASILHLSRPTAWRLQSSDKKLMASDHTRQDLVSAFDLSHGTQYSFMNVTPTGRMFKLVRSKDPTEV